MAKTYENSGTSDHSPQKASAGVTPYAKFIPLVVGLLVLFLIIGVLVRSQSTRNDVPGAASGASGTSNPAARPNGPAGGQER